MNLNVWSAGYKKAKDDAARGLFYLTAGCSAASGSEISWSKWLISVKKCPKNYFEVT